MAGRGRGRGRNVSFNVEALGFGRGESLPGPILQPPPLYPQTDFKPMPQLQGEEYDYVLALKQEFRGVMKRSPFYIQPSEKRKDIDRYSDKYQFNADTENEWKPDRRRLPAELKIKERKTRRNPSKVKPTIPKKKARTDVKEEMTKTLEELEKKEENIAEDSDEEENKEGKENEDSENEEDELYEEEEIEEETDYILSYFDNGEGYGDDDDDVDEGPVY